MVFNAVFNSISVISRRPVHLSMLSWSSFNQYSAQYSFQANRSVASDQTSNPCSQVRNATERAMGLGSLSIEKVIFLSVNMYTFIRYKDTHHNHSSVRLTIINPLKEFGRAEGSNQRPSVLKSTLQMPSPIG